MLGRLLFAVAILGVVVYLIGCPPAETPTITGDNLACSLEGYTEQVIRGRIRTSFDYGGGGCDCECDCTGTDFDFDCTITSTGGL